MLHNILLCKDIEQIEKELLLVGVGSTIIYHLYSSETENPRIEIEIFTLLNIKPLCLSPFTSNKNNLQINIKMKDVGLGTKRCFIVLFGYT